MKLRPRVAWRVSCTVAAIVVEEVAVCGVAAAPVAVAWLWLEQVTRSAPVVRLFVFAGAAVPSYVLFALTLMFVSAVAVRITGARTPPHAELRIVDMSWTLMAWVRYMAAIHVVKVFAAPLFRGSPVWTAYLRLNGARIGRRVYVNSLTISDHNLLTFGDDVVIGSDVHLSGHTVERGIVKTGGVNLGDGVTIGLGTIVDIDVTAGPGCQVGALSFVPKHSRLEGGTVYAGIPARPLFPRAQRPAVHRTGCRTSALAG